jgi:hypothetical protein
MTKAFDLALFVPAPTSVGDGVVVSALGPPFATEFAPLVTGGQPGVTVGSSVPAATKGEQILVSGSSAGFPWSLIDNPAIAATVPSPDAAGEMLFSNSTPAWVSVPASAVLQGGGAMFVSSNNRMTPSGKITFQTTAMPSVCLDGTDPELSIIDNFSWDAGTF